MENVFNKNKKLDHINPKLLLRFWEKQAKAGKVSNQMIMSTYPNWKFSFYSGPHGDIISMSLNQN